MEVTISTTEQLRNFISEVTFTEIDKIKVNTLIFDEGIFDSLGFLSLISYLQDEFGIEVESDELNEENFESIKAIAEFIDKKKNKSS